MLSEFKAFLLECPLLPRNRRKSAYLLVSASRRLEASVNRKDARVGRIVASYIKEHGLPARRLHGVRDDN